MQRSNVPKEVNTLLAIKDSQKTKQDSLTSGKLISKDVSFQQGVGEYTLLV